MRSITLLVAVMLSAVAAAPASAAPPAATTGPATNVTSGGATLTGTVSPNQEPTTYWFEYGTTTAFGARTPDAGPLSGNADRSVSAALSGLAPSTTYHFRLVARNASGTAAGAHMSFTTPPAAVTIGATPRTVIVGRATRISGTVAGAGAGVKVQLLAAPFPFAEPFKPVMDGTTADGGAYAFEVSPLLHTRYRVEAKGKSSATSADLRVNVRTRVTLRRSDRTPRIGQRVRFSGFVYPAHDGKVVKLQRRTRTGGWRTVARRVLEQVTPVDGVTERSRFSKRLRINRSGTYRAVFPGHDDHWRGKSPTRRVRVH